MRELSVGGDAQLDAGKLRRAEVEGNQPGRSAAKHGERVVARRGDREAGVAGLNVETLQQDVGILPALRVADLREVGARSRLALHFPPLSDLAAAASRGASIPPSDITTAVTASTSASA